MPIILHVDMNSYFASVEQQANPFLRGRAVGVCAYLHAKGCVIAASVEAKALGMKVGMNVEEASKIVPDAVFVENDPAKYRFVTKKIFALLHELSDTIEHYSIDEAFLDLTGWCRDEAEAAFLASHIKYRLTNEVGEWLRCSVGIAPTRFLAKFASERQKPDGLTIITRDNLDAYLAGSDLQEACGIGPRIARRLNRLGIYSLLALKNYPVANLMRVLGKNGFYLWCKVNGIECERVAGGTSPPKSIGHSYRVPNRVNRDGLVRPVLAKLTERAGRRLRETGLLAGALAVTVGIRETDEYRGHVFSFSEPIEDSFALVRAAVAVLDRLWRGEAVNFLAVTLTDFAPPSGQLRLGIYGLSIDVFRKGAIGADRYAMQDRREGAVSRSMDAVRDRYGEQSLVLGRMFSLLRRDEAPDRIGYRKTVHTFET